MGVKRTLTLLDAKSVGIGAIIRAGILVALGLAMGYAGPSIIISIIIAGIVAPFTAFGFAKLGSAIPKEGGAYEFAYELISTFAGFVLGCLWLSLKSSYFDHKAFMGNGNTFLQNGVTEVVICTSQMDS